MIILTPHERKSWIWPCSLSRPYLGQHWCVVQHNLEIFVASRTVQVRALPQFGWWLVVMHPNVWRSYFGSVVIFPKNMPCRIVHIALMIVCVFFSHYGAVFCVKCIKELSDKIDENVIDNGTDDVIIQQAIALFGLKVRTCTVFLNQTLSTPLICIYICSKNNLYK